MGSGVKVSGSWKTPGNIWVKVSGTWKQVAVTWAKVGGTWKITTFGEPPAGPIMEWYSTGVFYITNPVEGAVYTTTRVVGTSGNATYNSTNNRFTLDNANSGFNVYAQWAVGAPQATKVGYMERKARTQDYVYLYTSCQQCCSPNRRARCNDAPGPAPGQCSGSCGCYDGAQNRCICWDVGPPYCSSCNCSDVYGYVDHNWAPNGYTDRTSEWEKST